MKKSVCRDCIKRKILFPDCLEKCKKLSDLQEEDLLRKHLTISDRPDYSDIEENKILFSYQV